MNNVKKLKKSKCEANDGTFSIIFWCMTLAALLPEYFALVAFFVTAVIFFWRTKSQGKEIKLSTIGIFFLLFTIWQFVGIIYTDNLFMGVVVAVLMLLAYLVYLFTLETFDTMNKIEKIVFSLSIIGGIAGLIGIIEVILMHFGGYINESLTYILNPFWRVLNTFVANVATSTIFPDFIVDSMPRVEFIAISHRASSTFTNPLIFAYFLLITLPFSAYGLFQRKERNIKIISFLSMICIIGGIASSYSRGPYLATVLVIIILMFYNKETAYKLFGLSSSGLVVLAMVSPSVFNRFLTISSSSDTSINLRYDIWRVAIKAIQENKFSGMGTSAENFRNFLIEQSGINQPHAHNLFLELLVEGGVFGFTVFIAAVILIIYKLLKLCIISEKGRVLGLTFFAGLIGLLACGMLDHIFYGPKIVIYFMFLIGLSEASCRVCKKELAFKE